MKRTITYEGMHSGQPLTRLNTGRARPNYKRRMSVKLRIPNRISAVHCFERKAFVDYRLWSTSGFGNLSSTGGYGNDLAMSFNLTGVVIGAALNGGAQTALSTAVLPNSTEFTTLFDQYKIRRVKIEMRYANNNSSINSPSTSLPLFYYANDFDDAVSLTQTALQQFQGCKTTMLGTGAKEYTQHSLVPKPLVQLYESAVSTGYSNPAKPIWIDCNDATAPHYGFKLCWDNAMNIAVTDTNIGQISFIFTYIIECKNSR